MEEKWTDRLRVKMQDYEEAGPEGLWQSISDAMDRQTGVPGMPEGALLKRHAADSRMKRRRRYLIPAISAAAAILLTVYFGFRDRPDNGFHEVPAGVPEKEPERFHNLLADNSSDKSESMPAGPLSGKDSGKEPLTPQEDSTVPEENPVPQEDVPASREDAPAPATEHGTSPEPDNFPDHYEWEQDAARTSSKRKRGTIHASISSSNLTGSASSFSGFGGLASASVLSSRQEDKETVVTKAAIPSGNAGSQPEMTPYNTEIRHRQPVRVGVSVRYDFSRRWGIETGLTYSLLSSSITSGDNTYSSRTEQNLHFIGIPVQISYDFLQLKWFSMYVNAGGMMEKCVSGKSVTNYIPDGNTAFESSEDIMVRPLQWSLNAAVGAEVHFSPLVGLYVEPGVSYFFDNGSGVSTIYTEKPVNFNLEFGLRFSFR